MLGLKQKHVDTREQLNELEAANILQGQMWATTLKKPTLDSIFDRIFLLVLFYNMRYDLSPFIILLNSDAI